MDKDKAATERPLHAVLTASNQQQIENAMKKIHDVVKAHEHRAGQPIELKIPVNLTDTDPEFRLVDRLRGPQDQFLKHIEKKSNATVLLRGLASNHIEEDGKGKKDLSKQSNSFHSFIFLRSNNNIFSQNRKSHFTFC